MALVVTQTVNRALTAAIREVMRGQADDLGGGVFKKRLNERLDDRLRQARRDVDAVIESKGLKQVSDTGAIEAICDEVINPNPNSVADYKSGKEAAVNFLKGQVMKLSKGKANPSVVGEILERKLKS